MTSPPPNLAESYYARSSNRLDDARTQLGRFNYPESISASQETIEFAVKSIFLYLGESHPKTHEFTDEQFMNIIGKVPNELKNLHNFPRLLLITRFWSQFYVTAKYGNQKLGIGPENLFKEHEAKLALQHAEECHVSAFGVKYWIDTHKS